MGCVRMNSLFICSITAMRVVEFQSVESTTFTGWLEPCCVAAGSRWPPQAAKTIPATAGAAARTRRRVRLGGKLNMRNSPFILSKAYFWSPHQRRGLKAPGYTQAKDAKAPLSRIIHGIPPKLLLVKQL